MAEQTNGGGEYGGVEFYLDRMWRFTVPSLGRYYDTYQQMTDALDRVQAAEKRAKKVKLAIAVLTEDGKPTTITGINAGHGHVITKPPVDGLGRYAARCYPDVPWIRDAIAKRKRLEGQARHIDRALRSVNIDTSPDYQFKEGEHMDRAEQLEAYAARVRKMAEGTTLEKLLGKTDTDEDEGEF